MASAVSNLNRTLSATLSPSTPAEPAAIARAGGWSSYARSPPCSLRMPVSRDGCRCAVRAAGGGGEEKEKGPEQLQSADNQQPRRTSQAAPIGFWEQFPTARAVQQMIKTMERIMEDPFAYSGTSFPSLDGSDGVAGYRRGRTPWETEEGAAEYNMRIDMPGMSRDDVRVWVEGNMLVVKAEKRPRGAENLKEEDEQDAWSAKNYGRYNSRILLPEKILVEKIKSEVKDGVLYISIPKASAIEDLR